MSQLVSTLPPPRPALDTVHASPPCLLPSCFSKPLAHPERSPDRNPPLRSTTSDLVELYDLDRIPATHAADYIRAKTVIDEARSKNALERCQKFFLTGAKTPEAALRHVELRSRDAAEVRPELGHSTNAAIIVGRRELSIGRFLDRRIFLPSYDPFNDDDRGSNLETVLTPALVVGSGISLEYFFSTVDGGAGTKVPVNVVGNFGIQQGTAGDLLVGLATQMSELHSPVRALYLIDAPVHRVEAVLQRRSNLKDLVRNNWVRFFVRDPVTQKIYKQQDGEYREVDALGAEPHLDAAPTSSLDYVPFAPHGKYCEEVKQSEDRCVLAASSLMIASSFLPLYAAGGNLGAVDAHASLISASATALGLSNLAFSRRYLHGEFMFPRMTLVSALMTFGFNIVASAPSLEDALLGWTLIGFSSTFLIGGFNDRPTARDNAAFAFGAYQISDAALLVACAFSAAGTSPELVANMPSNANELAAAGLIIAAAIKSSQFPLSGLFLRSMEGASPNSALGYAGLSAHAGIVLLASTMPMWHGYGWANTMLALTGALTVIQSTTIANVRADRKGGIASAASATVGALFILMSQGYADAALLLSLGHASFRMNQVVRSPGIITDTHKWEAALGPEKIRPEKPYELLWRFGWGLNRINSDFLRLSDSYTNVDLKQAPIFYNAKLGQGLSTAVILVAVGSFHLPQVEEIIQELMINSPPQAVFLVLLNVLGSTALIRFLFGNVLDFGRFRQ